MCCAWISNSCHASINLSSIGVIGSPLGFSSLRECLPRRSLHRLPRRALPRGAVHPDGDVADARPGIEPGPQRPECAVVGGHRAPGEADSRSEKLDALVKHVLLDSELEAEAVIHQPRASSTAAAWIR